MSLIDIIVGVKNEEKYIERCINSLQNQTISNINIIVVDGLSVDRTPEIVNEIAENDSRVILLKNPHEVISSARNIGLESSTAKYVAYLDGHCYVNEDWLEILYESFQNYQTECKLGGVGSTYASPNDDSLFGKTVAYSLQTFFGGFGTAYTTDEKIVQVETVAFALYHRSTLLNENISYNDTMTQCEDTDFNYQLIRAGYHLLKHPKAHVYQYRRSNSPQFFQQMVNYGIGRARFTRKYPETLHWYHFLPLLTLFYFIFAFISLLLLLSNLINLIIFLIIIIPLIIYFVIDFAYSLIIVKKLGNWRAFKSIFIFPIVHGGYGWGLFKGIVLK